MATPHLCLSETFCVVINVLSCTVRLIDRSVEDFDLCIVRFTDYGKDFAKAQNMSPDAFIQLALQLTYYKSVWQISWRRRTFICKIICDVKAVSMGHLARQKKAVKVVEGNMLCQRGCLAQSD